MTSTEKNQQFQFLTIRNLLLIVTTLLTTFVVFLSIFRMGTALESRDVAHRAQTLNQLIDDISQFKLSLAEERLLSNTAYGFQGEVPSNFTSQISMNRNVAEAAYDNIIAGLEEIGPFDGKAGNEEKYAAAMRDFDAIKKNFQDSFNAYQSHQDIVDTDLETFGTDADTGKAGDVSKITNALINVAADLRGEIEANYDYGDDRIGTVNRLKHLLWVMSEYANREASLIGDDLAASTAISGIKQSLGQKYGGIGQGAWIQVKTIAMSATATSEIANQIEGIQNVFLDEFELERFDLYDLSIEAEEEGLDVVDYGKTADDWISLARTSVAPVAQMTAHASNLSQKLNEQAVSDANENVLVSSILIVLSLGVGAIAYYVVLRRVVKPVNQLSDVMLVLSNGNLDVDVPYADRSDEMGDMAKSVQVFKENAIERKNLEVQQREREEQERIEKEEAAALKREEEEKRRLADEQREKEAREKSRAAMLDLADKFEASVMDVVESLARSASGMEEAAQALSGTAADTSQKSDLVSNAAQQANSNAQMVASAAEELSSSVREITGQTNQSSSAARDAVGRTENASTDVANLVEAAQKIGDVVKLINDIAEQTNLLALNATIEAARAGDAGKGFAVVASEVKSLANQTAKATQEISEQVDGMQHATNLAVTAMNDIKSIITDIEATSVSIASAVEEQDASTQEIARNVSEVSTGTEEVTSNIYALNQGAATTGASATQVLSAAQQLTQQSDELKDQVGGFLKSIRA